MTTIPEGLQETVDAAYPIYEPKSSADRTDAQENAVQIKLRFRALHLAILLRIPNSRSRAEVLTHLESAGMWAVKAVHQAGKEGKAPPLQGPHAPPLSDDSDQKRFAGV